MRKLTMLADRMVARVAPKGAAAAMTPCSPDGYCYRTGPAECCCMAQPGGLYWVCWAY